MSLQDELARHRQMHRPQAGDSSCECGEWVGPFTITSGPGSYPEHIANALAPLIAQREHEAWDEGHKTCCDNRCFSSGNPYKIEEDNG